MADALGTQVDVEQTQITHARPEEIVRYYYGDDINFVRNAPIAPNLGGSWPGVTFRLGDVSEEVRIIQNRLNRISTNYPNIPKIYPADGIFDADTERAVRAFQQTLEAEHISATVRREMGADIGGACGQLRRSRLHAQI